MQWHPIGLLLDRNQALVRRQRGGARRVGRHDGRGLAPPLGLILRSLLASPAPLRLEHSLTPLLGVLGTICICVPSRPPRLHGQWNTVLVLEMPPPDGACVLTLVALVAVGAGECVIALLALAARTAQGRVLVYPVSIDGHIGRVRALPLDVTLRR